MHYTLRGTYEFKPNEDGTLSPSLYELNALSIRRLAELPDREEPKTATLHPRRRKTDTAHIIRLIRQWAGNAAVAAAVILFFFLSVPVENTYVDKGNYASLCTDGLFEAIRSQSLATTFIQPQTSQKEKSNRNTLKPVQVKVEKVAKNLRNLLLPLVKGGKGDVPLAVNSPAGGTFPSNLPSQGGVNSSKPVEAPKVTEAPKAVKKEAAPAPQAVAKKAGYSIIVSSLPTAQDAEKVAANYRQKGYTDVRIVEGNGRFRISLCNFADKAEAYRQLNELKKDEAFKNAWVLSVK